MRVAFRLQLELAVGCMEIVGLQWDLRWEDKAANFARAEELTLAAAPSPGALIVLPEMFATGFSMNVASIGEELEGDSFAFLSSLAQKHGVFVLGGVAVRDCRGRGLNQAVVVGPDGKEATRYQKMHPFRYGGEGDFYDAGSAPVLWRWGDLVVAPFVCYDLRFPEIYRLAARGGAELFITIANWPAARIEHWRLLMRARAVENQAYAIGVNRCGSDPKLQYPGASMAVDPQGNILAGLDAEEGWFKVEVDASTVRAYREKLPFLRDLRADLFRD
jgi:omega-amidase